MPRFPPERILVGVDLSLPSLAAWQHAERWAKRFGSKVKAVHAYGPEPLDVPGVPRTPGGAEALAKDMDSEFREKTGSGLEIEEGDPVVTLLRIARTWKAELLVVGTHGRTGTSRLLFGSVAEAVLRESPLPVLAVHEEPKAIRAVLAPVNFTPYAERALTLAGAVAAGFGAKLTAHHVAVGGETFAPSRARVEELVGKLPPAVRGAAAVRPMVSRGEPADAIARLGAGYDLVVLSGHRKGLLRDWLVGSTAQRVLRAARTPLLVVPDVETRFALARWSGASTSPTPQRRR